MTSYTVEQLEELLANAYAQRKQAYKVRAPRFVTSSINNQITDLRQALVKAGT